MKGIILAGGSGTRLYPITKAISKQLMPVYDKPMIYYPLSILMQAGIQEIAIITTPEDQSMFQRLLGDGSELGCHFEYLVQEIPNGLAQAFVIAEEFLDGESSALILGDNIFYGAGFEELVKKASIIDRGAHVFANKVRDPERYGIVEFDSNHKVISIEEKPNKPKSKYAIPGLYFYDKYASEYAHQITPSARGEYEITDLNRVYLEKGQLSVSIMPRGTAWLDTGTFDSLSAASEFVRVIEQRQQYKVGCIEEVAFNEGFINEQQLKRLAQPLLKSGYGKYLLSLLS